jgi:diguanylate cyclase (GGDEF)-like protein
VPLAVLMFDIDHFKQVNDTYGHVVGDRVLKNITNSIRQGIREGDILLRYGGEEFMVILPGASKNDAFTIAERVRHIVRESKTTFGENQISVTISVGLDSMPETTISDEQELITNADEALYRSKNSGRDKVTIH